MIDGTAYLCAAFAAFVAALVLVRVGGEFLVGHSFRFLEGLRGLIERFVDRPR